jgi:hypothetical protein
MNRRLLKTLLSVFFMAAVCPAFAVHGPLDSTQRDVWINASLSDLVATGLVSDPGKPVDQLTNFQVVGLTAQASQMMAQANGLPPLDTAPPSLPGGMDLPGMSPLPAAGADQAAKSLEELVEEFKTELTTLGIDVDKLEDKLVDDRARSEVFAALQKEYLKRTGTDVNGFSRGYMYNYRGFGANASYPPMDYNAAIFVELDLKSVPVPDVLFDARLRLWRSIGMYYQDPIQPEYQLRWLSLSNTNEAVNLTAGDFFKSYTPLTLWNSGAPVYTLIEPTSFSRNRLDTEELVYLDQAPDWHMRGFQLSAGRDWPKDFLSGFGLQAMSGLLQDATAATYASYYAGSEDSLSLLGDNVELKGVGLLMWQDPDSANVVYQFDNPFTYAKQYQIGSLDARATLPFADKVNLTGTVEKAFTQYDDDATDSQRVFEDWGMVAKASLNVLGAHLTAKYLSIGPYFYSPGAQTNAYTPYAGFPGYLSTNMSGIDDALPGYLNNFVFQDVNRPSFAPFDRLSENMLPYGDATPNREGTVLGFSADIGQDGWLKPQASYVLSGFHEIQPDYILNPLGTGVTAVDGNSIRTFGGYEMALTVSLDKALGLRSRTYDFQFDYKHQTTNSDDSVSPFALTVNTLILATDFNIPAPVVAPVIWSVAFEQTTSSGSEWVLNGYGNPTSLGEYPFFEDNVNFNNIDTNYALQTLNLTRTTLAFGFKYPLSDSIDFRGDYFLTSYNWPENTGYQNNDNIWRFTYEAHF